MKLFISYTRETGIDIAARIKDYLVSKGHEVYFDIESIHIGRFDEQIADFIKASDAFILLLTNGALESEWVRREIRFELEKEHPVFVPVFKADFVIPNNLPEDIASVLNYQGLKYDPYLFNEVMSKLENILTDKEKDAPLTIKTYQEISNIIVNMLGVLPKINMAIESKSESKIADSTFLMRNEGIKLKLYDDILKGKDDELLKDINNIREKWSKFLESLQNMIIIDEKQSNKHKVAVSVFADKYIDYVNALSSVFNKLQTVLITKR